MSTTTSSGLIEHYIRDVDRDTRTGPSLQELVAYAHRQKISLTGARSSKALVCARLLQHLPRRESPTASSVASVVVLMLPCAADFVHPGLEHALQECGYRTIAITGSSIQRDLDRILHAESAKGSRIVLHGWSSGGGLLLAYLSQKTIPVECTILFSAAGYASGPHDEDVMLFHNVYDQMISVATSEQNASTLGSRAVLKTSSVQQQNGRGNNHQCNEFVQDAVEYITERLSPHRRGVTATTASPLEDSDVSDAWFPLDDTFSETLYTFFQAYPLGDDTAFVSFTTTVRGKGHIQFVFTQEETEPIYRSHPTWDALACGGEDFPIKTNCQDRDGKVFTGKEYARGLKIFVHGSRNLFEYIQKVQNGKICRHFHDTIWERVRTTLVSNPTLTVFNHNRDVDTFHLKFKEIGER